MSNKITVTCKCHGDFYVYPGNFLKGCGCPECGKSSLETKLSLFLTKNKIKYEFQKRFPWLKNKKQLSLDFYLPDFNIAIECQGEQHLKKERCFENRTFDKQVYLDKIKNSLCENNGITILYYGGNSFKTIDNQSGFYTPNNYFTSLNSLLSKIQDIYIK